MIITHCSATFSVACNEIRTIVSGLNQACPPLNGGIWSERQGENKDTALTWFEWETAN